jgi:hypothetical protein
VTARQCQDDQAITTVIVCVACEDAGTNFLDFDITIVQSREHKPINKVNEGNVNSYPTDDNVRSCASVALFHYFLSLSCVNDNIHFCGLDGWSVTPSHVIKVAHGVDGNNLPHEVAEEVD